MTLGSWLGWRGRAAIGFALLVFPAATKADLYRAIGKGNTIVPIRSTRVAMAAETVVVEPQVEDGGFRVTAVFTMENRSDESEGGLVAFPVETTRHAAVMRNGFKVQVAEPSGVLRDVACELKDNPDIQIPAAGTDPRYHFAAAFVWTVNWAPRETKIIRVVYDMGERDWYGGFVEGWALRYIVRTGALWAGPIGKADIRFRFEGNPLLSEEVAARAKAGKPGRPPYSYAKNVRLSGNEIAWHFEHWTPDEDIWAGVMNWAGFDRKESGDFFFLLPQPYAGGATAYNDELLEQLVERELAPWKAEFPEEIVRDRAKLKSWVADWLYHEIFARHGDGFYLGKREDGKPEPSGAKGYDQEHRYYSQWSNWFAPYRGRMDSGWYRTGTGPGPMGSVRWKDLSPQEQRNAQFLRSYILPADAARSALHLAETETR